MEEEQWFQGDGVGILHSSLVLVAKSFVSAS